MDEEVVPVAETARQLHQRLPGASPIPAGVVRGGRPAGLLAIRLLLHAGVSHGRPAELRPQIHHSNRPARLRLRRAQRSGPFGYCLRPVLFCSLASVVVCRRLQHSTASLSIVVVDCNTPWRAYLPRGGPVVLRPDRQVAGLVPSRSVFTQHRSTQP